MFSALQLYWTIFKMWQIRKSQILLILHIASVDIVFVADLVKFQFETFVIALLFRFLHRVRNFQLAIQLCLPHCHRTFVFSLLFSLNLLCVCYFAVAQISCT